MPLTEAERAAYLTMPKASSGFVISLFYIPPNQLATYEPQWGQWMRENPKHLWPNWAERWIEKRKAEKVPRGT